MHDLNVIDAMEAAKELNDHSQAKNLVACSVRGCNWVGQRRTSHLRSVHHLDPEKVKEKARECFHVTSGSRGLERDIF